MGHIRTHPISLITVASLVWVVTTAIQMSGPDLLMHAAATAVLVSPLAILLWAHVRRARNWRHDLWLALCAVVIAGLCVVAAFLLAWFKPGWPGVWAFAGLLSGFASLCVLLVRPEKKVNNAA